MGSRLAKRFIHIEVVEPGSRREIVRAFRSKGVDSSTAERITEKLFEDLRSTLLRLRQRGDDLNELIREAGVPDDRRIGFYAGSVCVESQSLLACVNIKPRYPWFYSALGEVWNLQHKLAKLGVYFYTRLAAKTVLTDNPHPYALLLALDEVESYSQRPDVEESVKRATLYLAILLLMNALLKIPRSLASPAGIPSISALRSWMRSLMQRYSHLLFEQIDPDLVDHEYVSEIYLLVRSHASLGRRLPLFTLLATPRVYEAYLYAVIVKILEKKGWRLVGTRIDKITNCSGLTFDHTAGPAYLYMTCVPHHLSRMVCRLTQRKKACKTPRPDATLETRERVVSFEAKYRELNGRKLERDDAMRIAAYLFDVTRNDKLILVLTHVNENAEIATIQGSIDGKHFEVHIVPLTPKRVSELEALLANLLP